MKNSVLHLGALSILFVLPAFSSARMKSVESNRNVESNRARANKRIDGMPLLINTKTDAVSKKELKEAVEKIAKQANLSNSAKKELESASSPVVRQEILELADVVNSSVKLRDLKSKVQFLISIKDIQANNARNSAENTVLAVGRNSTESFSWDAPAFNNLAKFEQSVAKKSSTLSKRVSNGIKAYIGSEATPKEVRETREEINRECRQG